MNSLDDANDLERQLVKLACLTDFETETGFPASWQDKTAMAVSLKTRTALEDVAEAIARLDKTPFSDQTKGHLGEFILAALELMDALSTDVDKKELRTTLQQHRAVAEEGPISRVRRNIRRRNVATKTDGILSLLSTSRDTELESYSDASDPRHRCPEGAGRLEQFEARDDDDDQLHPLWAEIEEEEEWVELIVAGMPKMTAKTIRQKGDRSTTEIAENRDVNVRTVRRQARDARVTCRAVVLLAANIGLREVAITCGIPKRRVEFIATKFAHEIKVGRPIAARMVSRKYFNEVT